MLCGKESGRSDRWTKERMSRTELESLESLVIELNSKTHIYTLRCQINAPPLVNFSNFSQASRPY